MQSITVLGRRWFQKTYGNTYHTADILIDGELVHTLPKDYGYGDSYLDSAFKWLADNGFVSSMSRPFSDCQEQGITLHYQANDVSRERDL